MALVIEDGAGKADAESYASIADIAAYATARGLTFAITGGTNATDAETAARRATTWLDATYRGGFTGRKKNGRDQRLEWPRYDAHDNQCPVEFIADDEIPREIIDACCEAAIREKASPGALSPDVTPGTVKKRVRVEGAVEVEYAAGTTPAQAQRPIATVIDDILSSLIGARSSGYSGRAVRG